MRRSFEDKALARQIDAAGDDALTVSVTATRWVTAARTVVQVLLGALLGIAIWQGMAMWLNADGSTLGFPYPLETFERLYDYVFNNRVLYGHTIYEHLLGSIQRLLIAVAIAAVVGVTLGSILGYFGRIYQIGIVPVSIYQMIPGLAWLPVAILLFGLGDESAVFIIFAVTSMVITIGVSSGIRMVPPVLVDAAKMMGASGFTVFARVLIPQAAGSIVNALRLGMSSGWRVLVSAEMVVGTGVGIGYSIELTRDLLDYVGAFACITIICLLGLLLDRVLLAGIERWMRHRLGVEGQ